MSNPGSSDMIKMDVPWTSHTLPASESANVLPLLFVGVTSSKYACASGKIFSVDDKWEVYSLSLSDFSVSHLQMRSARPNDLKFGHVIGPVLSENERFLVLLSQDLGTLHRFELDRGEWAIIPIGGRIPPMRLSVVITICSSYVYLFAGQAVLSDRLDDLWRVDVSSDTPGTWEQLRPANPPPPDDTHLITSNGRTLIISGGSGGTWEYNPETNIWREVTASRQPFTHLPDHIFLVNDTLFLLSQGKPRLAALESIDALYKPQESSSWLDLGAHVTDIFIDQIDHLSLTVSDGFRILVFQQVPPWEEKIVRLDILDTRHITDRISKQPLLGDTQQHLYSYHKRLSQVKPTIDTKRFWLIKIPDEPVGEGGFCDIFIGTHKPTQIKLALKRPRLSTLDAEDTLRRVQREVEMWSAFDHVNILPFLGLIIKGPCVFLASPWMDRGDLASFSGDRVQYLNEEAKGDVPKGEKHDLYHAFDERQALMGVAAGIAYLHSKNFVHGDLKGKNVLLGEDNVPLLCDFGMTKALDSPSANTSTTMKGVGTLRWQSPELFMNEPKTFKSDIYALAMIIVEVLTGSCPLPDFDEFSFLVQVMMQNVRPLLEPASRNGVDLMPLWSIAAHCWAKDPGDRPSIDEVLNQLKAIPISENGSR